MNLNSKSKQVMKTIANLKNLLLLSILFLLQGCSAYYKVDAEKFFKNQKYESDKPFKMRDGSIQAPLMSQKGQFNITLDYLHGFSTTLSGAVSKRMFILGGASYLKSKNNVSDRKLFILDNSSGTPSTVNLNYNLALELESTSAFAAAGFYKTFGKCGRWDYYGGVAYGTAKNNYTYQVEFSDSYSFLESRTYFQYFLQNDFGYVTGRTEGAIISRVSLMHFDKREFIKNYPAPDYHMENEQFVFQPGFKFAWGRVVRAYVQCGWNVPLGQSQLKWFSTNVQAGIQIRLKDKSQY